MTEAKKFVKNTWPVLGIIAFALYFTITFFIPSDSEANFIPESESGSVESCQEGWVKYDLEKGTLCTKTELSQVELEKYIEDLG